MLDVANLLPLTPEELGTQHRRGLRALLDRAQRQLEGATVAKEASERAFLLANTAHESAKLASARIREDEDLANAARVAAIALNEAAAQRARTRRARDDASWDLDYASAVLNQSEAHLPRKAG